MASNLPDAIAEVALDHYKHILPSKGKPASNEWTVYAAIVASHGESNLTVVSCATGTKCTAFRNQDFVIHDAHAEVLARRGLLRVLWSELQTLRLEGAQEESPEVHESFLLEALDRSTFRLKPGVDLHMYVSDSPCGDASIYHVGKDDAVQFTGAKVIISPETSVSVSDCGGVDQLLDGFVAREDTQLLGKLRTKSGRSNLDASRRSNSMSCSDKLVRWGIFGLQGALLSSYLLKKPIRLKSVVVSRDIRTKSKLEQIAALERSIPQRITNAGHMLLGEKEASMASNFAVDLRAPNVSVVDEIFPKGKAFAAEMPAEVKIGKRKRSGGKVSPCGMSINWNMADASVELVVGVRGIRQGKKPKTDSDYGQLRSRLCRAQFLHFAKVSGLLKAPTNGTNYCDYKHFHIETLAPIRDLVFAKGPLAGWILGKRSRDEDISKKGK